VFFWISGGLFNPAVRFLTPLSSSTIPLTDGDELHWECSSLEHYLIFAASSC
jgi:hypothetical protein